MPKRKEPSRFTVAADAIGVTHMIIGTVAIVLGEFTSIFQSIDADHGGVGFVFHYLDAPVYYLIAPFMPLAEGDSSYIIIAGICIVALASIVYGVASYFILKFTASLFGVTE